MSKHTEGPWQVNYFNPTRVCDASDVRGCAPIADCTGGSRVEQKANARLIAAAPDLLETLEAIAGFAPGNGDVCEIIAKRARDAIAKATGDDDA